MTMPGQESWLVRHYEKLILTAVVAALLGSVGYLLSQLQRSRATLESLVSESLPSQWKRAERLAIDAYTGRWQKVSRPMQLPPFTNLLFVSELRVLCVYEDCRKPIPFDADVCPFCGRRQPEIVRPEEIDSDGDGLTDVYEKKVGLNPFDAADAFADPDSDGFSNIEEFQAGTNPFDSKDFPNPVAKLRVVRIVNRPFRMRFQGVQTLANGETRFLLNLRTLERSYFVKIGDVIDGYKVVSYEPKIRKTPAGKVDESVLTLRKGDRIVPLVKNMALTRYERVAYLALLTDASRFVVHVGDTITVRDRVYKIVDIRRDGVLLRDMQSGAEILVTRIAESELQELRKKLQGGGRSSEG